MQRVQLCAEQAHAPEGGEERDAGDRRGQHQRELEDGRDDVPAGEALRPEQVRHRRADDDDEGQGDQAGLDAHAQRVARDLRVQLVEHRPTSGTRRNTATSGSPTKMMRTAAAVTVTAAAAPRWSRRIMSARGQRCGRTSPALQAARRSANAGESFAERRGHGRLAGEMSWETPAAQGVTTGLGRKPHCLRIFWPLALATKATKRCASCGTLLLVCAAIGYVGRGVV